MATTCFSQWTCTLRDKQQVVQYRLIGFADIEHQVIVRDPIRRSPLTLPLCQCWRKISITVAINNVPDCSCVNSMGGNERVCVCVCYSRLHERSHSVWPQLWKDRAEYANPLYKAELSQTQGVLRPNTTPYCFKWVTTAHTPTLTPHDWSHRQLKDI